MSAGSFGQATKLLTSVVLSILVLGSAEPSLQCPARPAHICNVSTYSQDDGICGASSGIRALIQPESIRLTECLGTAQHDRAAVFESDSDRSLAMGQDGAVAAIGTTTRVSVASDGAQGNQDSFRALLSADGRYVAFASDASNLVAGDTTYKEDVFLHDRETGETTRVSVASDGAQGDSGSGDEVALSADGRYVAFFSWATNLVPGDTNGDGDIFVHDRETGETTRVSVASDGAQANDISFLDDCYPALSADGRYVAFLSLATNLVPGDTNGDDDIFVHDRETGETTRVSVASDGAQGNQDSFWPALSADGRYVAFGSFATNLVPGDTNNKADVFVHDRGCSSESGACISHIEVTQVVQDATNSVALVSGKPTFVRVFVERDVGQESPLNVAGVLRGYGASGELQDSPIPSVNASVVASQENWTTRRGDLKKTLNFTLPPEWRTGTVTLTADVSGITRSEVVTFEPAQPVKVVYVPVRYRGQSPELARVRNGAAWAFRVYPTAKINYVAGATLSWEGCLEDTCLLRRLNRKRLLNELTTLYRLVNASVFGWLPEGTYGGGDSDPAWYPVNGAGTAAFGDDHPTEGQRIFAHEIAHLLGRRHTNTGECGDKDPYTDWPYATARIQDWGLDGYGLGWLVQSPGGLRNPAATWDYMSYCGSIVSGTVWTSPWTYQSIYSEALGSELVASDVGAASDAQPYFIASGIVYTDGSAALDPVWVISSTTAPQNPPQGTEYCLEAQDVSHTALVTWCLDLGFTDYETGDAVELDGFNVMLPYPEGAVRIVLTKGAEELARQEASANPPVVTVTYPSDATSWSSTGVYTVTWQGAEPDGGSLAYRVLYSQNGDSWLPLGGTITQTHLAVDASELPGGSGARVRVLATDGINTSSGESDGTFSVARKPPWAHIIAPERDITIKPSSVLWLYGYAYDLEDGVLEAEALQWSSDRDGVLGTDAEALVSLSPGWHVVTLTVTDSDGTVATADVKVFVGYRTYLPFILRTY